MNSTENAIATETVVEISNLTTVPARRSKKQVRVRPTRSVISVTERGMVDQVKHAFAKRNLFATICGFILGGFVPSAVYIIGHFEVVVNPYLWVLVIGGLLYSAITVFKWGKIAFSSTVKSLGFVVLIEGTMTFTQTHALSLAALALLVIINGVSTGCNLSADSTNKKEK